MTGGQSRLPGVSGIGECDGLVGDQCEVAQLSGHFGGQVSTEPSLVDHLLEGPDPGDVPMSAALAAASRSPPALGAGVEPPETAFPGDQPRCFEHLAWRESWPPARRDLTVIGGHHQACPRAGSTIDQIAPTTVGGTEFGGVVLSEPVLVRDLVESVVVGVNEPVPSDTRRRRISTTIVEGTCHPTIRGRPDGRPRGRSREIGPGHCGQRVSSEGGDGLELTSGGRLIPGVRHVGHAT